MKLGQFEGVHAKLLLSMFKEIWSKPGGVDLALGALFFVLFCFCFCFFVLFFFTKMTKNCLEGGEKYKALLL